MNWNPFNKKQPILTPFQPGDSIEDLNFYKRLRHDMRSEPSRYVKFQGLDAEGFKAAVNQPWWAHYYDREPSMAEIEYVGSGQFDLDEEARKENK